MVRVVNSSHYGYGYQENNLQLAKRVSELGQQLSTAIQEIQRLRKESHQKDVKIVELEGMVQELATYRAKHDAIKRIILDTRPVESMRLASINNQTTSIQALSDSQSGTCRSPLRLQSVSHNESTDNDELQGQSVSPSTNEDSNSTRSACESHTEGNQDDELEEDEEEHQESTVVEEANEESNEQDNSSRLIANVLHPIIEDSEEEEEDDGNNDKCDQNSTHSSLPSPPSTRTISPLDDSLTPADVTSVPPIHHIDRTLHTPSIWNCLDSPQSAASSSKQQTSPRKPQSPARSVGSSTSGGLRISQNINSSSPIHPIMRKGCPNLNDDMFHSTPVQASSAKVYSTPLEKRSLSDPKLPPINQENVQLEVQINRTEDTNNVVTKKQPAKRGRGARAISKSKQPVRRAVKFTKDRETPEQAETSKEQLVHEPPAPSTRYNLRKRAKI